jgi:hypothetical protein
MNQVEDGSELEASWNRRKCANRGSRGDEWTVGDGDGWLIHIKHGASSKQFQEMRQIGLKRDQREGQTNAKHRLALCNAQLLAAT